MKKKHFSAQLFIVTSLFVPVAFTSSLSCTTKSRISKILNRLSHRNTFFDYKVFN